MDPKAPEVSTFSRQPLPERGRVRVIFLQWLARVYERGLRKTARTGHNESQSLTALGQPAIERAHSPTSVIGEGAS